MHCKPGGGIDHCQVMLDEKLVDGPYGERARGHLRGVSMVIVMVSTRTTGCDGQAEKAEKEE
jgi:hypothetical protein